MQGPQLPAEPTEEMVDAAVLAVLGCRGVPEGCKGLPIEDWLAKIEPKERQHLRHEAREALEAAAAATRLGDGLPGHHPATCGTAYFLYERSLRILENAARFGPINEDLVIAVQHLADEAGVPFARIALRKQQARHTSYDIDYDDIPF